MNARYLKYHGFVGLVIRQRRSVSAEFARLHFDGFYCASLLSSPRHAASDRKALSLREKLCIPRVYAGVRYPRTASGISLASRPPFFIPLPQIFNNTRVYVSEIFQQNIQNLECH